MYNEPSFYHVTPRELSEATRHAYAKYPTVSIDTDTLRTLFDTISRNRMGRQLEYVTAFRYAFSDCCIPAGKIREAYKAAVAKINAMRSHDTKARRKAHHTTRSGDFISTEDAERFLDEEALAVRALMGFSDNPDIIPL